MTEQEKIAVAAAIEALDRIFEALKSENGIGIASAMVPIPAALQLLRSLTPPASQVIAADGHVPYTDMSGTEALVGGTEGE